MKKILLGMIMALVIGNAMAFESRDVDINGKKIKINDISLRAKPDLIKFHTNKLQRGVYVNVQESVPQHAYSTPFPSTNKYVRQLLEKHGIKTVDQLDGADMSISFSINSSTMSMNDVEKQSAEYSAAGKVMVNAGAIAGMAAGGANPIALVGGVLGAFVPHDERISIYGMTYLSPIMHGNSIHSVDEIAYRYSVTIDYRLAKKDEEKANTAEMFEMLINEWVGTFIAIDTPQAESLSAVSAASSVAAVAQPVVEP